MSDVTNKKNAAMQIANGCYPARKVVFDFVLTSHDWRRGGRWEKRRGSEGGVVRVDRGMVDAQLHPHLASGDLG
jgi:hypothetical protein